MVSHRAFGSYQVGNGLGRALGGTGVMSPTEIIWMFQDNKRLTLVT